MMIIMGAFGHVGSEVVKALLREEQEVIVVTHDPGHAWRWEGTGAQVALADVNDPDALRAVFRQGRRAFLLNPPAAVDGDTDKTERRTVARLLEALKDSGLGEGGGRVDQRRPSRRAPGRPECALGA
ncbi:SDR family oxidoreductase [Roseateles chitinivorans]|uniref:SDR family oxidoreductase n=1 Tax=Roseateles chitinivorans TaxID=2917965 RepID=UPI003D6661D3